MIKPKIAGLAVFIVLALVFLSIKVSFAEYSASDENTYYKMGQLAASGDIPYKDFFFAHPPLQIYAYALVFLFFGFNLGILKFISAMTAVVAGYYVFRILNERSEMAAMLGTSLFFFTNSVLLFTSFPTGTEFVMMFSAAAFYYFLKGRYQLCGVLLGFGFLSGYLAAIPAMAMGGWILLKNVLEIRKFVFGFAAVVLPVTGLFVALSGGAYITQTLVFNLLKPEGVVDKAEIIMRVLARNWLLVACAATVIFAKQKMGFRILVPAAIIALYAAAFYIMGTVFDYYSLVFAPFLAVIAGLGISGAVELFRLKKIIAFGAVGLLVGVVSVANVGSFVTNDSYDFNFARDAALFIEGNSDENATIFGEDATTPLISLLSGREIALNFIDSNDLRFRTSIDDADEIIGALRDSSLKFFLVRSLELGNGQLLFGVATLPEFSEFLEECTLAKSYSEDWNGARRKYDIYDCS